MLSRTVSKNIINTGKRAFKSEAYIAAFLEKPSDKFSERCNIMYAAQAATSGGYISGEIKLAITLRLLAGGDALDLADLFDISYV